MEGRFLKGEGRTEGVWAEASTTASRRVVQIL